MVNDKRQIMSKKTLSKSLMPAVLRSLTTKSTQSLLHHCIPPLGGVRGRLLLIFLLALISCTETQKEQPMKMNITALNTQGLEGDLQKGVSAAYAALIDDNLLVAGGCNFPDKLGFEGGKKVFYDEILLFNKTQNQWQTIGKLPEAAAYGASVAIPDGYLW